MTNRIRGSALQRIRRRVLRNQPLCVECLKHGKTTAATQVDHITAIVNGGSDDKHDDSNRQALCDACHDVKTRKDLGQAERTTFDQSGRVVW